jgi:hypothetical protein
VLFARFVSIRSHDRRGRPGGRRSLRICPLRLLGIKVSDWYGCCLLSLIKIKRLKCNWIIVADAATAIGWRLVNPEVTGPATDFTVLWQDTSIPPERLMQLKPYQVYVFQFPDCLTRLLNRVRLSTSSPITFLA